MTLEYGALIGGVATAAAAAWGFRYAARELELTRDTEKSNAQWRRVEFVRSIVDHLNEDEEVQFCLRALDWGVGPLLVPMKHRPLFDDRRDVIMHDVEIMEKALEVDLVAEWETTPQILLYRHSFDHFFSALENLDTYGSRLGDSFVQDVGLLYYLGLVRDPPYLKRTGGQSPIEPFVRRFYGELHMRIWA